jgi:predicted Zn-dependent protease
LDTFFNYFLFQTSGAAKFNKLSQLSHQQPVTKDVKGEKLTLSSDPGVITSKSRKYDPDGLAFNKLDIIKENQFLHHHSSKKYADYIGLNHPTALSTVCVDSGTTHYADFTKERPVLELAKFSTFAPDETTGNFSGEIRQGMFYGKDKIFPIKGCSISGKIQQAFQNIYFSKEKVLRSSYFGPQGLLVKRVTISGA